MENGDILTKRGKMAILFLWKLAWPFSDGFAEVEDEQGRKQKIVKVGNIVEKPKN